MVVRSRIVRAAKVAAAQGAAASATSDAGNHMRLLAIPLARARPGSQPVVTYVAQRPAQPDAVKSKAAEGTASGQGQEQEEKPPLSTRLLNRASNFWMDLGKPGTKSTFDWKRRTYNAGEKLMDRIDYTEWALKAIDPAMGPEIKRSSAEREDKGSSRDVIHLLYPRSTSANSFQISPSVLLNSLRELVSHRTPHHRSLMIYCVVGMPFTIPFALVPVVPNLPFFYLVWRAYSHWKAWKSSEYLENMVSAGRVQVAQSKMLEDILSAPQPAKPPGQEAAAADGGKEGKPAKVAEAEEPADERIVLQPHHIDLLKEQCKLDRQSVIDLRRARMQAVSQLSAPPEQQRRTGVLAELERITKAAEQERQQKR